MVDGSMGTWRIVDAIEEGRVVETYVEVGTRKARLMIPKTLFHALVASSREALSPDADASPGKKKG